MTAITFADLKNIVDGSPIQLALTGIAGYDIDHTKRQGQVTLYVSESKDTQESAVIDLDLPLARTIAAALLSLCDWVEHADAENQRKDLEYDHCPGAV